MDKNEHSIFAYVMDQLDENGIYQGGALIDDPTPSLPRPLGSDDAYIYTAEMPPDLPGAEAVCSMLLAYADEPSATAKVVLEEALIKIKRGFETTKKNGTGMGLVIVSEIVSNAKGRIDFVPSKDRGLLVKITFPLDTHEQKN